MENPTETSEMAHQPQQLPEPVPQPPPRPESLPERASRVRRVPFPILPTTATDNGQVADPLEMLKAALYPDLRKAGSLKYSNPTGNGILVLDNGEIVELKPPRNLSKLQATQAVAQYYQKFAAILWHHIFDFQDETLAARYDRQEALEDLAIRQESLNFELDYAQAQISKWKAEAAAWKMKYNLTPSRNPPSQNANHTLTAPIPGTVDLTPTQIVMTNTQFVSHAFTTQAGRVIASTNNTGTNGISAPKPTDTTTITITAKPKCKGPPTGIFSSPARKPSTSSNYSQGPPRYYYHTQPTNANLSNGKITTPRNKSIKSVESPRNNATTMQDDQTRFSRPHYKSPKYPFPNMEGDTTETDSDLPLRSHSDGNKSDPDVNVNVNTDDEGRGKVNGQAKAKSKYQSNGKHQSKPKPKPNGISQANDKSRSKSKSKSNDYADSDELYISNTSSNSEASNSPRSVSASLNSRGAQRPRKRQRREDSYE